MQGISGVNLSGVTISGVNLNDVNISGVNLNGVNITIYRSNHEKEYLKMDIFYPQVIVSQVYFAIR